MTDTIRFFQTLKKREMDRIDKAVKAINDKKPSYVSRVNRQSVIRGLVKFALEQDIKYESGYSKHVTVSLKRERITLT